MTGRCAKPVSHEFGAGIRQAGSETTTAFVAAGGPARIGDVAGALFMSRSTLQRRLATSGLSFTELRRQVRVQVALRRLTSGASCAGAARAVGLTGDHLCRLITCYAGVRPREIARACQLAARAQRWRRSTPPRSGSRLYAKRMRRWQAVEVELGVLLAPIPSSGHPLSAWARRVRHAGRRPDYRRGPYRTRVRAARRHERAAYAAERRRIDAWWAQFQRTQFDVSDDDIVWLGNLDVYIARRVDPVSGVDIASAAREQRRLA